MRPPVVLLDDSLQAIFAYAGQDGMDIARELGFCQVEGRPAFDHTGFTLSRVQNEHRMQARAVDAEAAGATGQYRRLSEMDVMFGT